MRIYVYYICIYRYVYIHTDRNTFGIKSWNAYDRVDGIQMTRLPGQHYIVQFAKVIKLIVRRN